MITDNVKMERTQTQSQDSNEEIIASGIENYMAVAYPDETEFQGPDQAPIHFNENPDYSQVHFPSWFNKSDLMYVYRNNSEYQIRKAAGLSLGYSEKKIEKDERRLKAISERKNLGLIRNFLRMYI